MALGNHVDIDHTVHSQSIPACIGAVKGGGNCCAIPVSISYPFLKGMVRGRTACGDGIIHKIEHDDVCFPVMFYVNYYTFFINK